MANFVISKVTVVHLDYLGEHTNDPVNIDLCRALSKSERSNGYGTNYPIINFKGCGVIWHYDKDQHKLRDEDFIKVLNHSNNNLKYY